MAMQINGNYAQSKTDYAEWEKEKQAALRAEKAKEAHKCYAPLCIVKNDGNDSAGLCRVTVFTSQAMEC